MSTQIDNVVTSFNEVLLQTSSVFDELYKDKSTNLVLPNQQRPTEKLNEAISSFNHSLDSLMIQLNDVALFELRLEQQAEERAQKKKAAELIRAKKEEEQVAMPMVSDEPAAMDDTFNGESNNILDDINDFLSTVPETGDIGMTGDFNDNIQQLLMENNGDYGSDNGINMADFGIDASNDFGQTPGNQNGGANGNANGDSMNFDDNIFNEIDSMLNI